MMLGNKKSWKPVFTDLKAGGHIQNIITNKKLASVNAQPLTVLFWMILTHVFRIDDCTMKVNAQEKHQILKNRNTLPSPKKWELIRMWIWSHPLTGITAVIKSDLHISWLNQVGTPNELLKSPLASGQGQVRRPFLFHYTVNKCELCHKHVPLAFCQGTPISQRHSAATTACPLCHLLVLLLCTGSPT